MFYFGSLLTEGRKPIFLLLFLLLGSLSFGIAQEIPDDPREYIEKKVDKNRQDQEATPNEPPPPTPLNSPSLNQVEEGRILPLRPEDDFFNPDYAPNIAVEEEEVIELPDNVRLIDTLTYLKRSGPFRDAVLLPRKKLVHYLKYEEEHQLPEGQKVFGWHPVWMKDAYLSYNFSLLSHIAYHAYQVDPTSGEARNDLSDWKSTPLVQIAREKNPDCKVLLSLRSYGEEANDLFLRSARAQNTCIQNSIALIEEKSAQGIHLDFGNIPPESRRDFLSFVINFSFRLKNTIPNAVLSLGLPVVDPGQVFVVSQMNDYVDLFVLTGLEYYGENTPVAGPVAPIVGGTLWWQYGLEQAVTDYITAGVAPQKMLLTVPYYGNEWVTESLQLPAKSRKFQGHWMYRDIQDRSYVRNNTRNEPESMSSYVAYTDGNLNSRQLWFEDTTSLSQKYTWVKDNKIGGVAIWALGYDNGRTELWELLATHFAVPPEKSRGRSWIGSFGIGRVRTVMYTLTRVLTNPASIQRNPGALFRLLGMFGLLGGTSMIGFLMLYRYGCRMGRRFNFVMKGSLGLVLLAGLVMAMVFIYNAPGGFISLFGWVLALAAVGAIVYLIMSKQFSNPTARELP